MELMSYDLPTNPNNKTPRSTLDESWNRFEVDKTRFRSSSLEKSIDELIAEYSENHMFKLSLVHSTNEYGSHKTIKEFVMSSDAITQVESVCTQILGGIIHATKHLIKLPPIKDLSVITEFESLLVPASSHHLHQSCDTSILH